MIRFIFVLNGHSFACKLHSLIHSFGWFFNIFSVNFWLFAFLVFFWSVVGRFSIGFSF